jgi:hypothetical protein
MTTIYLPKNKILVADIKIARAPSADGIKSEAGLGVHKIARFIFDAALNDSAGVSNTTVATHGTGVFLPINAIILRSWYQVKTPFTSTDSTATIAFKANSAGDMLAAVAVSGNPGTAAIYTGIQDYTVTHMIEMTAEREISVAVAVEALTAGRLIGFVEYCIGE